MLSEVTSQCGSTCLRSGKSQDTYLGIVGMRRILKVPPREGGGTDMMGGRGRRAVGVMMVVTAGASPCARFKVSCANQHLSPERQAVAFFSSFAGVTGVTVAPLPSRSASGSARLTATPQGAQGRCRDGTRAVRSEFPSSFPATFAQSLPRYLPGTHRPGSSVTDSS